MERITEAIEARPEGQGEADSGLEFVSVQRVRLASGPACLGRTSPANDRPSAAIWQGDYRIRGGG